MIRYLPLLNIEGFFRLLRIIIVRNISKITRLHFETQISSSDLAMITDAELLEFLKSEKNQKAFEILVRKYSKKLYSMAYRMLGNTNDAEDIVQEAFLKLWNKPQNWNPKYNAEFITWFYRVVINMCIDLSRKKKIFQFSENFDMPSTTDLDRETDIRLQQEKIERLLLDLPLNQRIAINLCFYEGISNQAAADIMGLKLKALQSLLSRAKEKLKAGARNVYNQRRINHEVQR